MNCKICKEDFEPSEYQLRNSVFKCNPCLKKKRAEYYQENREKEILKATDYWRNNKERAWERNKRNEDKRRDYCTKYYRENRSTALEYQQKYAVENAEKVKARSVLNYAKKAGKIKQQPCEFCGTEENIEAHHEDYSKPLEVRWLCQSHHSRVHGGDLVLKWA